MAIGDPREVRPRPDREQFAHDHGKAAQRSRWLEVLVPAVSGLIGALIGGGSAYLAASADLDEKRTAEIRQHRASVYHRFLEHANSYAVETTKLLQSCPRGTKCTLPPKGVSEFQRARFNFQGAINDVYVYGSNRAVDALRILTSTLPPSLAPMNGEFSVIPIQEEAFTKAYQGFQHVMCQEVSPSPNDRC